MMSRIPTRRDSPLFSTDRRRLSVGAPLSSTCNGSSSDHRTAAVLPLRDSNARSSSVEPTENCHVSFHKPLKMLKSEDNIAYYEHHSHQQGDREEVSRAQVINKILRLSPTALKDLQVLLSSLASTDISQSSSITHSNVNLWIENILLKSQVSLQQEGNSSMATTGKTSSTPSSPPAIIVTRDKDIMAVSETVSQPTQTAEHSQQTAPLTGPGDRSVTVPKITLDLTNQCTQTDLELKDVLTPDSTHSLDSSSSHLQQRLEAVTISKELLESSLDDAKRQIASLERTVTSQREDLLSKESQITTISNRVATLMKSFESTQSDSLQYRTLYYRSLQQCTALQEQLEQFNVLFTKLDTLFKLQGKVSSQVSYNAVQLEDWLGALVNWESNYIQKKQELLLAKSSHQTLEKECESLHANISSLQVSVNDFQQQIGRQLSHAVISSAKEQIKSQQIQSLEDLLAKQRAESKELHGKIAQLVDTFQRSQDEFMETVEFAEIERQTLLESNKELEGEVKRLKGELQKGEAEFKKLIDYTKEFQAKSTQKAELLKLNVAKADTEIEELDRLLERVRQVLHENESVVSQCDPLAVLLKELDGNETVTSS